jgi:hypothetical protein
VIDVRSTVPLITDVALRVGGVTETVNIAADALLEASSVASRVALGAALIEQLPSATPSKQIGSMLLSAPGDPGSEPAACPHGIACGSMQQ